MKKFTLFFALLFSVVQLFAQNISGQITDDLDRPISNALIYIDGTSFSTFSNDKGEFKMEVGKLNNGTIIFKKEDYETFSTPISKVLNKKLKVVINKVTAIDEVVMTPYTEDAYKKFILYFKENFIGHDHKNVTIKNIRTLKFSYNKTTKLLKVKAPKTLIIENKNLGYEISFDLMFFEADFSKKLVSYYGTSYFKETSNKTEVKKNRVNAFLGSQQHFLRSVYNNEVQKNGFKVNYVEKQSNPLYPTEEQLQKLEDYTRSFIRPKTSSLPKQLELPKEIAEIAKNKNNQSKNVMAIVKTNISLDDYITIHPNYKTLKVNHILQVIYPKTKYIVKKGEIVPSEEKIVEDTFIYFDGNSFDIYEDGNISDPENFIVNGAFSSNTVGKMLPSNYQFGD